MCAAWKHKYFIIIIIITVIVIVIIIILLSIYLLGSPTVYVIRLNLGKEIHPIPLDQGACPRNLRTI